MRKAQQARQQSTVRALAAGLVLAVAAGLSACSSSTLIDHIPTSVGGLPEGTPERPAQGPLYPAVHDLPPSRGPTVLSEAEKKRLREELILTRERARQPLPPDEPSGAN
jgi:hypothetical protein